MILKNVQCVNSALSFRLQEVEQLTNENWLEALQLHSRSRRLAYYTFLSKKQHYKEAERQKKKEVKIVHPVENRMDSYEHGRIFTRIYDSTIRR